MNETSNNTTQHPLSSVSGHACLACGQRFEQHKSFALTRFAGWSIEGATYTSGLEGGLQVTLRKGRVEARVTIEDTLRVWPVEVLIPPDCPMGELLPFLCAGCRPQQPPERDTISASVHSMIKNPRRPRLVRRTRGSASGAANCDRRGQMTATDPTTPAPARATPPRGTASRSSRPRQTPSVLLPRAAHH